ncbi:MAG: sulfur carrier protein ThiS adenylyltransferase ThiF [Smithellaceae bacterium]|nr:sulfur carrier protein ThiS adenylyltransferase ThiF [Smithellaceae bacterium]
MIFRDALISKIGSDHLRKVQGIKIGLAGAGGLGSNCAANLIRSGFQKLKIVDFDRIEPGNLDRQFYFADQVGMVKVEALKLNLLRINPLIDLEIAAIRLDENNFASLFIDCDVVAECLDRPEIKSSLVAALLPLNKLIVSVSGLGGYGQSDDIRIHRIKENLIIIGDLQSDITTKPALSPRVNIAAAKQADVILEYACSRITSL